jgi:signal transduction histidine kinase/CheY-like chemotaxis protein
MRPAWFLVFLFFGPLLVSARQTPAREVQTQREGHDPRSAAWFELGCEEVEVELMGDLARAEELCEELLAAARDHGPAGAEAALQALLELVRTLRVGPAHAHVQARQTPFPVGTSPSFRAVYHTARARRHLFEARPTEVLTEGMAGLAAAREVGSVPLRLRAAWLLHDLIEDEATLFDDELQREIAELAPLPGGERFEPWRRLYEYWDSYSEHTLDERAAILEEVALDAEALGDLSTLCEVYWERAVLANEAQAFEETLAWLAQALEVSQRAGDLRHQAITHSIRAGMHLDRGELEPARAAAARLAALVEDAGMPDEDIRLAHLRLRLAGVAHEEAEVVSQTTRLQELRLAAQERDHAYGSTREQVLASERRRIEMEEDLREARARSELTLDERRRWGLVGTAGVLGVLLAFSWIARRRLRRANVRLQEEMRRTEEETRARVALEQRLRLVERSESLGLIASGVAHDFNNLLAAALGRADLRLLDAIEAAGERGRRLCGQLQTYAGDETVAFERLDVGKLLGELVPVLEAAAGPNLELALEPVSGSLPVEASRSQLEQAVLNLVANARDARAQRVVVRARRVRRTAQDWREEFLRGDPHDGEYVHLEVKDDGEGLSAELIERIFDPFFTTRFPGRGLGLAVVLGVVRRHAGVVTVRSSPGSGTTFGLYFPLGVASQDSDVLVPRPPARVAVITPPPQALRILIVDDEAPVRKYLEAALLDRGHRVAAIGDGRGALEAWERLGPGGDGVALVDLTMPVVDGRDVVRALRALADPPAIVLMSGHAAAHLAETARELGVEQHLAKPFKLPALEQALLTAADRQRARVAAAHTSA